MSLIELFSNKTLCVALAPDQLTAAVRGGASFAPDSAARIALDHPEGHWQGALAALDGYLQQAGAQAKGLPLSVSLSNRWCHLTMLPWSDALLAVDTSARFLEAQFAGLFGDAARSWIVTCDDAPFGQPRLACAIERELLESVQAIAAKHGHQCVAVEPALSIAWRAVAPSRPAAFALLERGRMVLASAENGRITGVHAQACRGNWQAELAQAWQRWTLRVPQLAAIGQVALVKLDEAANGALPEPFHAARLPLHALAPAYAAVSMMGR
ncbi:MAG: hypothetical protein V4582_15260 [Pseudomonadota bacterium]